MRKVVLYFILFVMVFALYACGSSVTQDEQSQQQLANSAIVQNQPVPDLGGYSFERQIMIDTYIARNSNVNTYAYMFTMDGKIVEICPSIGFPIPYSTQLSNPTKVDWIHGSYWALPNAEPNSLYPPADAAATLVQCVQPDGSVTPVYIEWYVLSFPYRIKSDYQIEQTTVASFTVPVTK